MSGSIGIKRNGFYCTGLTIASVKEKDIKPITMDAILIGASGAMATVEIRLCET